MSPLLKEMMKDALRHLSLVSGEFNQLFCSSSLSFSLLLFLLPHHHCTVSAVLCSDTRWSSLFDYIRCTVHCMLYKDQALVPEAAGGSKIF